MSDTWLWNFVAEISIMLNIKKKWKYVMIEGAYTTLCLYMQIPSCIFPSRLESFFFCIGFNFLFSGPL